MIERTDTAARLRLLAALLPPTARLQLDAEALRELAEPEPDAIPTDGDSSDYTLAEVGTIVGRAPSTVRDWCRAGRLPGAYRQNAREWRVPREALRAFRAAQSTPPATRPVSGRRGADLGSWRREE